MPSPPSSSSSMIFNSLNLPSVSSTPNFNATPAALAGSMSASSPLTSFYGSTIPSVDTLNNNIIFSNNSTTNHHSGINSSYLTNKTSAHSASHSALAAAAALQSLNQTHLQRSHQLHAHQQQPNNRPPSNSSVIPPSHLSGTNMPKLGITSTTSSDHQNHNHLALPSLQSDSNSEISARFSHKQQQQHQVGVRAPINWQDHQANSNGNPRWQYANPFSTNNLPTSMSFPSSNSSLTTTSAVNSNLSNSNNMIGQDGDNQANTRNANKFDRLTATNQFGLPNQGHEGARINQNIPRGQNYQWLDSLKAGQMPPNDAAKIQSQRLSDELEKNSERLSLFAYNLLNTCIPNTNKPKKIVLIDSIDDLRQSIYCGEFYSKFEDIAIGILTNQVYVPEFSIIDYIRRDKSSHHEAERMDNVHKKLGIANFLSLIELANQRSSYLPTMIKANDFKPSYSETTSNLNIGTGIFQQHHHQQQQSQQQHTYNQQLQPPPRESPNFFASLPSGKSDINMPGLDKSRRSSQSPSDFLPRSQPNNGPAPRLLNSHPFASQPNQIPLALSSNTHLHQLPVVNQQRSQHPAHARSSPFHSTVGSPNMGTRPPRANSTIGFGVAHEAAMVNLSAPRQPPAAHQSSSAKPATDLAVAHQSSAGPPVSAHMSSVKIQTPRLQTHDNLPTQIKTLSCNHSPGRPVDDRQNKFSSSSPGQFAKSDIDQLTSLPVPTLLSLNRQQELVNREIAMKGSGTPHFVGPNNGNFGAMQHQNMDVLRSPMGTDPHLNSRSPINSQLYSPQQPQNFNNCAIFKTATNPSYPNMSAPSSMPPPSLDYLKNTSQHEPMRFNDPKSSTIISSNVHSLPSEAHLKQYSALMSAYQQQQQQQQQQQLMMAQKNNQTGPLRLGMNLSGSGYNNNQTGLGSPHSNSDTMLFEMQNQQQAIHDPKSSPLAQQPSPKQGIQRSIITGSGSTAPKRNKKVKNSPSGCQPSDNKPSISPMSVSSIGSKQSSMPDHESVLAINKFAENSLVGIKVDRDPKPAHGEKPISPLNANDKLFPGAPSTESATAGLDFSGQSHALQSITMTALASGPESTPQHALSNDTINGTGAVCEKNISLTAGNLQPFEIETKQDLSETKFIDSKAIDPTDILDKSSKVDSIEDRSPDNLKPSNDNSSSSQVVEPSKYQKLYTKKAWIQNYDQEDQERLKNIAADNMAVSKIVEIDNASLISKETKSAVNKSNDSKVNKNSKVDIKKKIKDQSTKKSSSSTSARTSRASKLVDSDLEASDGSTSDLDSDDTASLKSSSDKRLRRMPNRKVKPNSDKDDRSPKSKTAKDSGKKRGKRDDIMADEQGEKQKQDEVLSGRRTKKARVGSKLAANKQQTPSDDLKRRVAARNSVAKLDEADADTDSKASNNESKKSSNRAAKSKDLNDSKSNGSQSDNDTLYSSLESDDNSLPSDEVKSSNKKRKNMHGIKRDPKRVNTAGKFRSLKTKQPDEEIEDQVETDKLTREAGEKFLQTDPCYDIVPKNIRCLECRRIRQSNVKSDKVVSSKQSSKANWDDFCRFYEFRKLKYNKSSQIVSAGFSDLDDAKQSDKILWLPHTNEVPENLSLKVAKFILSNVGGEFCNLVMQERTAINLYKAQQKGDKRITWKRAVNGLRELCDVCATTLFNCHYVCERCGFVVCIDCHQSRLKGSSSKDSVDSKCGTKLESETACERSSNSSCRNLNDSSQNVLSEASEQPLPTPTKKSKRDSYNWIYCAKNEEHTHEKLILTQIIAGNCLEEVWTLLHRTRQKYDLGKCICEAKSIEVSQDTNETKIKRENGGQHAIELVDDSRTRTVDQDDTNSESSHSTLKGLLLASNSCSNGAASTDDKNVASFDEKEVQSPPTPEKISIKIEVDSELPSTQYSTCSSTLNDDNMFNDSSNEDDSQEDSKLSQQVTAAIEGCISSLPDGDSESPDSISSALKGVSGKSELDSNHNREDCNQESKDSVQANSRTESDTHSWLCDGDLLVLLQARHKLNVDLFKQQWRLAKPVLVRGVDKLMKIDMWLPQFFGKEFGDYRSDLVDCRNGDIHRHSMKKYWEGFEPTSGSTKKKPKEDIVPVVVNSANNEECSNAPSYYSGTALWRLKDWPPGQDFYEILPSHYEDFMNNLPLKAYTTRSGKLNLACRLPREMLKPDLGPKMYSAYGTSKFPERGTTNLHLDISDAINVMVYVSGATSFNNGSDEARDSFDKTVDECFVDEMMKHQIRSKELVPGALWHVFKPSDAQKMRNFLNKIADERYVAPEKRTDPIHDQTWYLDQVLLDRLYQEQGVKAFAILQCMGDAILIPAGAPHQVKNLQNCIKVANDFVSPENVRYCLQLTNEFRSLPETHINQEDKLQIKNILYHSVKKSLQYINLYESGKISMADDESTSSEDSCDPISNTQNEGDDLKNDPISKFE